MLHLKHVALVVAVSCLALNSASAQQAGTGPSKKPNILVIFGDDVGYWNVSAYNRGMMGYRTPNIDRLAKEARSSPTTMPSNRAPRAAPRCASRN
jgi:hypothetical protein